MIAVSVAKMRELESLAIEKLNIPSVLLMENAAYGFVSALKGEISDLSYKKICVLCGKGNNAGDGYAIARILHFSGFDVSVFSLFDTKDLKGDAKLNCEIAESVGIPFIKELAEYDIFIDAIFGTGFYGDVESDIARVINFVNNSSSYVASVDITSGVSADNGQGSTFICADLCVSFGYAKCGHFLYPARNAYKKLIIVPISVPKADDDCYVITSKTYYKIPKRQGNSHKGTYGKVLAFVGSFGMAGAAILSGSAILKSGAGMATVATSDNIISSLAHHFPSVMTYPIPTNENDICDNAAELILRKTQGVNSVLIGCGLGKSLNTKMAVTTLITDLKVPMVIDADGLNILAENPEILNEKKSDIILTPHIVEFSRLSGYSIEEIKQNPLELAREFAVKYDITLILKDATTVIASNDGKTAILPAENSGMATAGSGDVLAGITAGLLSQGMGAFNTAVLSVYIHSAAGRISAETLGEYGMTSSDILENVPEAFLSSVDITPFIKEM